MFQNMFFFNPYNSRILLHWSNAPESYLIVVKKTLQIISNKFVILSNLLIAITLVDSFSCLGENLLWWPKSQ